MIITEKNYKKSKFLGCVVNTRVKDKIETTIIIRLRLIIIKK